MEQTVTPESAGKTETIKGTIEYEITLTDKDMSVQYNNSLQNDLAAISIASLLTMNAKQNLNEYLKNDKNNKEAQDRLNRAGHGLVWLKITWESLYTLFLNGGEKKEAIVVTDEIKVTEQQMPTEE